MRYVFVLIMCVFIMSCDYDNKTLDKETTAPIGYKEMCNREPDHVICK